MQHQAQLLLLRVPNPLRQRLRSPPCPAPPQLKQPRPDLLHLPRQLRQQRWRKKRRMKVWGVRGRVRPHLLHLRHHLVLQHQQWQPQGLSQRCHLGWHHLLPPEACFLPLHPLLPVAYSLHQLVPVCLVQQVHQQRLWQHRALPRRHQLPQKP